jgi:hypothetical protein
MTIMAEKIIKIPLEELITVRLVCGQDNCGGAVELPISRLEALTGAALCPSCNRAFAVKKIGGEQGIGGLKALGLAVSNLTGDKGFRVEFLIHAPDF